MLRRNSSASIIPGLHACTHTFLHITEYNLCLEKKKNGKRRSAGIVTKVAIQCAPMPAAINTLLCALPDWRDLPRVHALAQRNLAEILSAIEFFDLASLGLALRHIANTVDPFGGKRAPMYVLIETSGALGI
jgi:FAD/FMN-containing dehydrogenase